MSYQTLVIGDVHGCADELDALLDRVGPDRVVLVGDLFTKGPHPERVWVRIRDQGFEAVLGNHEQRLLDFLDGVRPDDRKARRAAEALDRADPGWRLFVRALPLFLDVPRAPWPMTVVHAGLHPSGDRARTTRAMALTMRRWTGDAEDDRPGDDAFAPFWWQRYRGEAGVVYGHDARRGLIRVERDRHPLVIGLDTGCVYGGKLSGWIAEQDEVVQVDARAPWAPIH